MRSRSLPVVSLALVAGLVGCASGAASTGDGDDWPGIHGLDAPLPEGYVAESDEAYPDVVTLEGSGDRPTAHLVVATSTTPPAETAAHLCELAEGQGRTCTAEPEAHGDLADAWYLTHTDGTVTTHQYMGVAPASELVVRFYYDADSRQPELEEFLDDLTTGAVPGQ